MPKIVTTIARTGQASAQGSDTLSKADLKGVVRSFLDVGRAPVCFEGSCTRQDAPKAGTITAIGLTDDGKRLEAVIDPVEGLEEADVQALFDEPTLRLSKTPDGTPYLHSVQTSGRMPADVRRAMQEVGLTFADLPRATFDVFSGGCDCVEEYAHPGRTRREKRRERREKAIRQM